MGFLRGGQPLDLRTGLGFQLFAHASAEAAAARNCPKSRGPRACGARGGFGFKRCKARYRHTAVVCGDAAVA